jgi:transcription elongation GreA/GreB family factor
MRFELKDCAKGGTPAERAGSSQMNKAFVRDSDAERASNALPDRPIPPGPNLVTSEGLAHLDAMVAATEEQHRAAVMIGDPNEVARTERDLRYWTARRATAQPVEHSGSGEVVEFGSTVRLKREDGQERTYRIVGVDEADPSRGTLSHISPLAKALLGKSKGDTVTIGATEAEILAIR